MFRAISCSSSGGQIVLIQYLVSSLCTVSDRPVHRLKKNSFSTGAHSFHIHIPVRAFFVNGKCCQSDHIPVRAFFVNGKCCKGDHIPVEALL
jgi:hypothetical protein